VPGETWPNRTFLHCGTSEGTVEIEVGLYDTETIFDRLEEGRSTPEQRDGAWRIYVDDGIPHVAVFRRLWSSPERRDRWSPVTQFARDVEDGTLPAYSFIEPRHQPPASNSQHPGNNSSKGTEQPSDFERGEHLLAHVYETLRRHPAVFNRTLLVITYDENGGLFDHVPPPRAVAPGPIGRRHWTRRVVAWFVERHHYPFTFRRLGARVPALVVSPLVPAAECDIVFDHTSIPATLRTCFAPGTRPLSRREGKANQLIDLPLLAHPRTDLPDLSAWAERPTDVPATTDEVRAVDVDGVEADSFSRQLDALAARLHAELPPREATVSTDEVQSARVTVDRHRDVIVRLLGR
jgi:phospholipase C